MSITKEIFGTVYDGQTVELYTITNAKGASVKISTLGCAIVSILLPDRDGKISDIALGYDTPEEYIKKPKFIGVVVGRYANRITKGQFTLNGETFQLECNNGQNALHGGSNGFDKQIWQVVHAQDNTLALTHVSPDGDGGYPGRLSVTLTYQFNDDNELSLHYLATSSKDTVCSFTHHCYFNLVGHDFGSIADQIIQADADYVLEVNSDLLPSGRLVPLKGTAVDMRTPVRFGDIHKHIGQDPLLPAGKGVDLTYVLNKEGLRHCVTVCDPQSCRQIDVTTDMPCMHIYSGGNLTDDVFGKGNAPYPRHSAFCLETQQFTDAPNHHEYPSALLRAGEEYDHTTIYRFGISK